jgi:hypothetical protein
VLILPSALQRQPRLDCARWVASCAGIKTTPAERGAVLRAVKNDASPSLSGAAAVLKRGDAISAVLSLVAQGVLAIDLTRPLGPHSGIAPVAVPLLQRNSPVSAPLSPHRQMRSGPNPADRLVASGF